MSELVSTAEQIRQLRHAWGLLDAAGDNVADVAAVIDYVEAAKVAAKRAGWAEEAQREWAVLSLTAQRKAGQLLLALPKSTGNRYGSNTVLEPPPSYAEVLDAETTGEANMKAKRWQDVARVPHQLFMDYLASEEPSRARLLRLGRDAEAAAGREHRAREDAEAASNPWAPSTVDLRIGDLNNALTDVRDVDAVICDPPYEQAAAESYAALATWADYALTDDGVLVVLTGQTWLPEFMRRLEGGRPYRWTCAYLTPGHGYVSHGRRVQSNWKPLLVYGGGPRFGDVITTAADDKAHHHWGQDFTAFTDIVERFTRPGQLVVDPFLGGGTTAAACLATGRRFIGCDRDPEAVETTRQRLQGMDDAQ